MFDHYFDGPGWLCGPGSFLPGPFGMILTILFWGVIIMLVFKAITFLFGRTTNSWRNSSNAMDILKERYAKGEITRIEFEQLKKDIA